MRFFTVLGMIGLLASCGAGSAPTHPDQDTKSSGTGITVSGTARIGVVYGPKGTRGQY